MVKRACFLLGDGSSIDVWSDPWVPRIVDFRPQPRVDEYKQIVIKASDLIDSSTKSWITEWVNVLFTLADATTILSIPIPYNPKQDRLIWFPDSKGRFSVKSVHKVAFISPKRDSQPQAFWLKLWKAKFPESLKMLIWRISVNAIPAKENLQLRLPYIDPSRSLCNEPMETCTHIFFECPFAKALWAATCWGLRVDLASIITLANITKFIMESPASSIPAQDQRTVSLNMALVIDEI